MKLYVANPSNQIRDFVYRVIETKGVRRQMIPIGGQIAVAGDLNRPQIDGIIRHFSRYGLVSSDEAKSVKGLVPLIYSIDKPVTITTILAVRENNKRVLVVRGKETRQLAAVSANNLIESHLAEANNPATLDMLEVSIVEEDRKVRTGDEGEQVAEGVRVTRNAEPGAPQDERRQRRTRKDKRAA